MPSLSPIAVIGLACWYPDARTPLQLWENILGRRRQFRCFPDCRMPMADYYHPDPKVPDKTYGTRGAFIDGFTFDWVARRIPLSTFRSTDIAHWLALEVALQAIFDAGYSKENIAGERTGVIVGNTLTGEQTRSNTMRLRWPYVRRALHAAVRSRGLDPAQVLEIETAMESFFKSAFPPVTEDTLAGGLSNTIAGRICNVLDLHGGGYTVDGACSSSLLAVVTAAKDLANGDLDLALAGGVDISLDPFEMVGFAKTGALTKKDMTVYDRCGSGFIPGEGCGFVILKRLEDARRDNNYIYAVLHGWGIASDGAGTGLTAPNAAGQARALRKAYNLAPYDMDSLDFVEGHGTATAVGDQVELKGIALAMGNGPEPGRRRCGVTSLKSIMGHAKAAAGIGGFIKAVMAVNRRILPPTAACRAPHPLFDTEAVQLYPLRHGVIMPESSTLRAGASAMGFGGINCHVTLASADPPSPHLQPGIAERALLVSNQDTELFVLGADSGRDLEKKISALIVEARKVSVAELADLAAKLGQEANFQAAYKAALIAGEPTELALGLEALGKALRDGEPSAQGLYHDPSTKIWLASKNQPARLGMLFCGQSSQQLNMVRVLVERLPWAQKLLSQADEVLTDMGLEPISRVIYRPLDRAENPKQIDQWLRMLSQTECAQPAICFASIVWYTFLDKLGVRPALVGGHSLGELSAFYAAGVFTELELIRLAAVRGKAMASSGEASGAMVSLRCSRDEAKAIIDRVGGYIILANINGPAQMVLSGEQAAVAQALELAGAEGVKAYRLNVSNAFHSRMASDAAQVLREYQPLNRRLAEVKCRLFSSASGQELAAGLALNAHFSEQVLAQVDFVGMINTMSEGCDLFLEVGPGRVLSGLANAINGPGNGPACLPVESEPAQDQDLNAILAELFVRGHHLNWHELYAERLIRPYVPPQDKLFIENQCEHPFNEGEERLAAVPVGAGSLDNVLATLAKMSSDELAVYLHHRGPFLAKVIQADLQYSLPLPIGPSIRAATARQTPIPPAETPASAVDQASSASILLHLIEATTGFPPDSVSLASRLLDDLNLDAIKAGDVIVEFAKRCGVGGQLDSNRLANATLQEVIDAVTPLMPRLHDGEGGQASVEMRFYAQIEKITGFPKESLNSDMRLLDDLNLDSIKASDLISQTAQELGITRQIDSPDLANATLAEIIKQFSFLTANAQPLSESAESNTDIMEIVLTQAAVITGYPKDSIDLDAGIEENLNISDDMLRTLLIRSAAEMNMEIHIDLPPLRNRSLRQIAGVLERIINNSLEKPVDSSAKDAESWVREFAMELEEEPLVPLPEWWGNRQEDDWQAMNWLVLYDQGSRELSDSMRDRLHHYGAKAHAATFTEAREQGLIKDAGYSHIAAILPHEQKTGAENINLKRIVERLASVSVLPPVSEAPRRRTTLAYIQFGGGFFGMDNKNAHVEQCCTKALAASLHLERADLRVRVLDFSLTLDSQVIVEKTLAEINTPAAYNAVGYDFQQKRRIFSPRLLQPVNYQSRNLTWSAQDIILVTGGARGITASCALRVARATGAQMVLVGRSPHPDTAPGSKASREIAGILKKYKNMGLVAHYYSCDMADREAVTVLVDTISHQLGAITGIIHGAGLNIPRLASQTKTADVMLEISPKIMGMMNLLEKLKDTPPQLIVGLTSIIGITGMEGNAWYGFSNESLDILLRNFQVKNPQTQTQSIAYSIWRDEGMGARLGSVAGLKHKGIDAIPTEEGVARFAHLFLNDPGDHQVVVTSRLGGLDTWNFKPVEPLAKARFLEKVQTITPGVESVFTAHLSLEQDPYLKDHLLNGSYLLPTVFGLEAMAQAVAHVSGEKEFNRLRVSNIKLERPITVDPGTGADIIVRAIAGESGNATETRKIYASVAKDKTGVKASYFSATFELGFNDEPPSQAIPDVSSPLPIQPVDDLYRESLLFQGPLFQRIEQISEIKVTETKSDYAVFTTRALSSPLAAAQAFPAPEHQKFYLGDPFFRDSLLQSTALLIPQGVSLPIAIGTLDIYQVHGQADAAPIQCMVKLDYFEGNAIRSTVVAVDNKGSIQEKLSHYDLRVLRHDTDAPTVMELLCPDVRDTTRVRSILERLAGTLHFEPPTLQLRYLPGIHNLKREERRKVSLPLLKDTAKQAMALIHEPPCEIAINWLETGRPLAAGHEGAIGLSLSHDDRLSICVAGPGEQGCDTAPISHRTRDQWQGLLGKQRELLDALVEGDDALDQAGTRIWAAMEAMKKATGKNVERLEIVRREGDAVIFSEHSEVRVITIPLLLTWGPARILAFVVREKQQVPDLHIDEDNDLFSGYKDLLHLDHMEVIADDGPQGQPAFVQRFLVTFRPSAQLSRTLYFSKYVEWIGEVREASVWPVLGKISKQFSSGEWGQVTNYTSLKIFGEAGTHDLIEAHTWAAKLDGPADSTLEFTFDFRKTNAQGQLERLATLTQETSWVKILGQGMVRPEPFADYYGNFIRQLLPRKGSQSKPLSMPESLGSIVTQVNDQAFDYQAPTGPTAKPFLHEETIETGLDHANLVGNIYFANYFTWQGRARDRFFFSLVPEFFRGIGAQGELICLESRVDHLREAMPFDRIVVVMALQALKQCSAVFSFEYFRQEADGRRLKIAFGEQKSAWVTRATQGEPSLSAFPAKIQQALEQAIARHGG